MKKIVLSLFASILIFTGAYAQTDNSYNLYYEEPCCTDSLYGEIFCGSNFLDLQKKNLTRFIFDTGYVVSTSVGYRWCNGIRLELEYAFRHNSIDKIKILHRGFSLNGHFQSSSYMANLLWDLPTLGCDYLDIQSYIGGGIGDSFEQFHINKGDVRIHENRRAFAWQLMAGLAYPIACDTDISIEYKFFKADSNRLTNHSVGVGLKYKFCSFYPM